VPVFLAGLQEVNLENEIAEPLVSDERNVDRRTKLGLILALTVEFESPALAIVAPTPRPGIGRAEANQALRGVEMLLEDETVTRGQRRRCRSVRFVCRGPQE
jgi:hypothetical protein